MSINWEVIKFFNRDELECRCGCRSLENGEAIINLDLITKLDELRERCGFPLPVNSGLRCIQHNIDSGGHPSSAHCDIDGEGCMAVDLGVNRARGRIVLQHALEMDCWTGIGISQHSKKSGGRFIHLDLKPRGIDHATGKSNKALWSYS